MVRSQLKVIKADGDIEEYIHTKVIGTISVALSKIGRNDVYIAEQLADVVTYYLYHQENVHSVTSGEIFSVIVAVLTETGYENAAEALCEYHFRRKLKRLRTEVISIDIQGITEARILAEDEHFDGGSQWDKSRIVNALIGDYEFDLPEARMIASVVEDRIFNMEITKVPTSLIKQIVLNEAAMVMRAQKQLLTA